ncbi:MAG: hypothetical protein FWE21_03335 [Defluviitaleaceae bacterium]|nr:hypothetical protein [Defluviitaleaceae bacterium]
MRKKVAYTLLIIMIAASVGVASVLAYSLVAGNSPFYDPYTAYEDVEEDGETGEAVQVPQFEMLNHENHDDDGIIRISLATVMVYEYYDPATSTFERFEEVPSPILLGKSRDDVASMFVDWRILSFTSEQVHLRQNDALEHRKFIISAHEGFVAVFYDNDQRSIKELTNRPIHTLAQEEQVRLEKGISVTGNEELMRALEDFGS